jgi:hypothetical protein
VLEVGTVRRFFNPWVLIAIAAAIFACAEVWPNPT